MTPVEALENLRSGFATGRLAQAYIIAGNPRGAGGELAGAAIRMLFCEGDRVPCGACPGCRRVAERVHPDVLWVEPQKRSRIIAVEQVRDMQHRVFQTAFEGGWKACVILCADRLNESSANAFLKTLEEPPGRTMFLLVTDSPQSLLPTIRSRCQLLALTSETGAPAENEEWVAALRDVLATPGGRLSPIAACARADGVGRILKTLKDRAQEEVDAAAAAQPEGAAEEPKDVMEARVQARYRELRAGVMVALLEWYRDLMVLACGADPASMRHRELEAVLARVAAGLSPQQAVRNVLTVEEMNRKMERNLPDRLVLTHGFGSLT